MIILKLKKIAKKIPFLALINKKYIHYVLNSKDVEQRFTNIYRYNKWNGKESISGTGSDIYNTKIIIKELPILFNEYGISTMLDLPCGDFNWMRNVDLNDIDYTGADIVIDLI